MPSKGQKLPSFCYLHCDKAPDWGKCQAAHDSRKGKKTLWEQLTNGTKGKVPTKGWKWRGVEGPLDALKSPTYKWLGPRAADCHQNPSFHFTQMAWERHFNNRFEMRTAIPGREGASAQANFSSTTKAWERKHLTQWTFPVLRPPLVRGANTAAFGMAEGGVEGSFHEQNLTASSFRVFKSKGHTECGGLPHSFQPSKAW